MSTQTALSTLARRQAGNATPTGIPTLRRRKGLHCPPGIVDAGAESLHEIAGTVLRSGTEYWGSLVSRGANPWDAARDLMEWARVVGCRRRPTWASPNTVIGEWPLARLRDFSPDLTHGTDGAAPGTRAARGVVPTLILPPQAGHDSCIVDFAPGQSQVATALAAGCTRVASMDWIGATRQTRDARIEEYLETVRAAIDLLGGQVDLVGDCQGGWLATIYAAMNPQTVHTLTIAGAPVDFHAGEPLIHDWMQVVSPLGQLDFYRAAVQAGGGMLPGDFLLTGFKLMQPEAETQRQLALLANIRDPRHVERYRRFEDWFQWTQPIPGAFYLWIVEHLFMNNDLLRGTLEIGGRRVDLTEIHCPIYLLAGARDHITPPAQVFALADYVSTPPEEITQVTTGGGHLGIFMGRRALQTCWQPVFAELAARSLSE